MPSRLNPSRIHRGISWIDKVHNNTLAQEKRDYSKHVIERLYQRNLSGGQQQRAAIARALANDPPIVVTDEPTGNLDSNSAEAVLNLFEDLVNQGKTVLMVTHDPDLAKRASRTVVIAMGRS